MNSPPIEEVEGKIKHPDIILSSLGVANSTHKDNHNGPKAGQQIIFNDTLMCGRLMPLNERVHNIFQLSI